jgi:type II secretory pathway component PulC
MLALVATLTLSACGPSEEEKEKAAAAAAAAEAAKPVPAPAATADKAAWQNYLSKTVKQNMQGVKTNHPYMYFVPGGDTPEAQDARKNQLDNVGGTVARGVLPGNMMAFGGPDSKITADLAAEAFKSAQDGSFKDVVVLFVGATADQDRLKDAVTKSGAEFRFVEMK